MNTKRGVQLASSLVLCWTMSLPLGCAHSSVSDVDDVDLDEGFPMLDTSTKINDSTSLSVLGSNGIVLQGSPATSLQLTGVALQGATLGNVAFDEVLVDGGELVGVRPGGTLVSGSAFQGAQLQGNLSNGTVVSLRIDSVQATNDADIFQYSVAYWNGASWKNLCGTNNGTAIRAIPLAGRWDTSSGTDTGGDFIPDALQFTFACEGSAIAKCVQLAYAPWRTAEECLHGVCREVSLMPVHQACTRMVRADYCGNGASYAQNGTPIDVYDTYGIQTPSNDAGTFQREAEWSSEGALCIEKFRSDGAAMTYVQTHCPERLTTNFACFGAQSTFFVQNGFNTPLEQRSLLRNKSMPN